MRGFLTVLTMAVAAEASRVFGLLAATAQRWRMQLRDVFAAPRVRHHH